MESTRGCALASARRQSFRSILSIFVHFSYRAFVSQKPLGFSLGRRTGYMGLNSKGSLSSFGGVTFNSQRRMTSSPNRQRNIYTPFRSLDFRGSLRGSDLLVKNLAAFFAPEAVNLEERVADLSCVLGAAKRDNSLVLKFEWRILP
jgi:hypothetical protein